jgi:phosphopantetheinyl transferase (holo-ACP synthase)
MPPLIKGKVKIIKQSLVHRYALHIKFSNIGMRNSSIKKTAKKFAGKACIIKAFESIIVIAAGKDLLPQSFGNI